jgi:outer membrane protein TolC
VAAADLRRLTGMAPVAPFTLGLRLSDPIAPPDLPQSLVAEAQERRPERHAHQLRIEAAGARKQAAAAGRRPMVAVGAGFDYARPNPEIFPREARWQDSWDLGVNVRWSLWDGGRVAAEVAEASAREVAATERLNEFEEDLVTEVWQRRLTLISRLASIEAAEDGVRSAAEARRVNAERFAAGVATSTELLDAQVVLLSAELDRTRAQAEARLAEAQLRRAIGR